MKKDQFNTLLNLLAMLSEHDAFEHLSPEEILLLTVMLKTTRTTAFKALKKKVYAND